MVCLNHFPDFSEPLCMSMDSATRIPAELRAGDTITWRRTLADYPASDGWELRCTLVGPGAVYNLVAVPDGDDHVFTASAAVSAAWTPAGYQALETAHKSGERYTLGSVRVVVLQDLATASVGTDTRSHARKVLDSLNAWLESKAPTAGEVQIADRRIRNYDLGDLLALRDRYAAIVKREDAAANGGRTGRLLVRL